MTVAELISTLKDYVPEAEVELTYEGRTFVPASSVSLDGLASMLYTEGSTAVLIPLELQ